jgi:hypothetical protein
LGRGYRAPRRLPIEEFVYSVEDRGASPSSRLAVAYFLQLIGVELRQNRQDLADAQVVVVGDREHDLVTPVVTPGLIALALWGLLDPLLIGVFRVHHRIVLT